MMMKVMRFSLCLYALFIMPAVFAYEDSPVVTPAQVLSPELLQSIKHRVKEVEVRSGIFHFYIESDFGDYYIDSLGLLRERVREIIILGNAVSHGGGMEQDLSGKIGDQFQIRSDRAVDIFKQPVRSATKLAGQVADGINETLGGEAAEAKRKVIYSGGESSDPVLAVHKRNVAGQWRLDAYSTNSRVQEFLDTIARQRSAGNISAGTPALNRVPVKPLKVADAALETEISGLLKAKGPAELNIISANILEDLKIGPDLRAGFLQQTFLSPRHKTRISEYLKQLADVGNLSALIRTAIGARSEREALAAEELAMMLADYHHKVGKLRELRQDNNGIDAVTVDGRLVHFVVQDMIYWDQITEQFYDALLLRAQAAGITKMQIVASAFVTPEAKAQLQKRRFELRERDVF